MPLLHGLPIIGGQQWRRNVSRVRGRQSCLLQHPAQVLAAHR